MLIIIITEAYLVSPLDSLEHRGPLLGRVVGIRQQELCELPLRDPALVIRVFPVELQSQDFPLQLVLELQEALDRQFTVQLGTWESGIILFSAQYSFFSISDEGQDVRTHFYYRISRQISISNI